MPLSFALLRVIVLFIIITTNVVSSTLSAMAFHAQTGGSFQILTISVNIVTLLFIVGCLCHKFAHRDEEASNTRNVGLFGVCGLLGFAIAVSLTVHARQDHGVGLCNDFANAHNPWVLAGVQLSMAYVATAFAVFGFVISWIDKYPGAVKVMPRYPTTMAPNSAHMHELDGSYTCPPTKISPRSWNNSGWSDVPFRC